MFVYESAQVLGVLCVRRTQIYNNNNNNMFSLLLYTRHYHTIIGYDKCYLLLRYCVKGRVYYYYVVFVRVRCLFLDESRSRVESLCVG